MDGDVGVPSLVSLTLLLPFVRHFVTVEGGALTKPVPTNVTHEWPFTLNKTKRLTLISLFIFNKLARK